MTPEKNLRSQKKMLSIFAKAIFNYKKIRTIEIIIFLYILKITLVEVGPATSDFVV